MRICYTCLRKECDSRAIAMWKSDLDFSIFPERCDFCSDNTQIVTRVGLHTLGNRPLARLLLSIYDATERAPGEFEKNCENICNPS